MAETDAKPIPISPTSNTFGVQEQTRTTKEFSHFDYRKMLLNIDQNLTESDICRLKYLCLDTNIGLRHGELETASRGLDVLDKLEKRGRLSKDNLGIIIEMLSLIERIDLKVQVEKCLPFAERGKKTNCISAYRRMVVDFAYDIGKNDLSSLKPLLRDHMAARKIEKIDEPIKLMIELEKLMIISPTNLDFLKEIGLYIGSNELVSKVTRYRGSSECGDVKDEHSQSSSKSKPVVQEKEYQDVQETFNSLKLTEPPVNNQGSQQESYISYLASSLGDEWRMLGYKLGLSAVDMDGIEDSHTMLLKWQKRTNPEQQMDSLCEALGSPKIDRQDLSNYLKNEMSSMQSMSQPVEATPSLTEQDEQRDAVLHTQTKGLQIKEYSMTHATRGICLIINNMQFIKESNLKERKGSEVDEANLNHVFNYLGFDVEVIRNATGEQMMNKIIDVRKMDHSKYDCFVCCILSHGDLGKVYGIDGVHCKIIDMTSSFRTGFCKTLANKPKLFFLQACQGTRRAEQHVQNMETDDAPPTATENIPDDADFLLGYATAPGNVSYRSKTYGSWYITKLTQNLKRYHHTNHILDILTQVNNEVSQAIANESNGCYKQVPAPQYTLRKNLYFPKL